MTFESVDRGDEDEAQQPIKPARCRCYMPTTAMPPPVITAADQVRRNLRLSAKWARFGRLMVEQLLSEHDAAVERADAAERELAEVRAEAADPFNPQRIAEAVKRARRQRDEAVEAIAAERDEYVEELARLREQLQSATVLPERWRELLTERDAARRELAEVRERIGEQREEWGVRTYDNDDDTEVMRTREQAEDLAAAWRTEIPNSNPTVRVRTQRAPGPWRDVEDCEWKAADDA